MTPSDPRAPVPPASTPPPPALAFPDLCDDVLFVIFSHLSSLRSSSETPLKHLSLTNRRLHALLAPQLFKTLHINVPIKLLHADTLCHFHAHTLKIDMFGSKWWWSSGAYVATEDALDLFRLIHKLKALRKLEVSMLARSTDIFRAAFMSAGRGSSLFALPIETLIVSSSAAFLAAHCFALERLVVHNTDACVVEEYIDLRTQLAPLCAHHRLIVNPRLQRLDASALWSINEVLYVANNLPHLESLTMRTEGHRYVATLANILSILKQGLAHLRTLHLLPAHALDVGFRPIRRSTILVTKMDHIRLDMWRQNECRRVQAENNVARHFFTDITGLGVLWLGEQRVARRVREDTDHSNTAGTKAAWMWERDVDERDDSLAAMHWADVYWAERDAVVVRSELGHERLAG